MQTSADRVPHDGYRAGVGVVEAHQQAHDGGLARAARSHEAHPFSLRDGKVESPDGPAAGLRDR